LFNRLATALIKLSIVQLRSLILADGELVAESVVKENLTTAADGKRYRTQLYNLDLNVRFGAVQFAEPRFS